MRPGLRAARAVAALVGATGLLTFAFTAPPAAAEDETVTAGTAGANIFVPNVVTIDPGDTVTWQWGGGFSHTVTATSPNWGKDSPVGPPASEFTTTRTFNRGGTYTYVCKTHGDSMSGTVVVRRATATPTVRPTRTPTVRPTSPRPTGSATATASPTASVSPTPTPTSPSPTASPASGSPRPSRSPGVPPLSVSIGPGETPFLGVGGLTPAPATGRAKGLPVMLALLLLGGVGSAELRALLANAPRH